MAKKKSRPAFNLPSTDSSAGSRKSDWVYRSDKEPAAEPAAPRRRARPEPEPEAAPAPAPSSTRIDAARGIVGSFSMMAAGAGLVPVPALDMLAIGGLQLKMISALSDHYKVPFSKDSGKAVLSAVVGGVFSTRFAYGIGGSLLKAIPVIGPVISSFAMPGFGAAFTYAVGTVFVQHFESGGTLRNADGPKMRGQLDRELQQAQA